MNKSWHNLKINEIAKILNSDLENGLTEKEAKLRLNKYGFNKIKEKKELLSLKVLFNQFKSPLIYILIIAGIITVFLKDYNDSIIIFLAIFINTLVGFLQEYKAEKTLLALKKIIKLSAKVIREGKLKVINAEKIVPGDIVFLNAGDQIPADGRVIEAINLKVNEMILTGESELSEKTIDTLPLEIQLADRENMVYFGTIVEEGIGKILITETGDNTELGKIAKVLKEVKREKTPYQIMISNFSRILAFIIVTLCFMIFILGVISKRDITEMFLTSVSVAVAGIPEGLPIAITVIFALGMQRILIKKGLVKKLITVETLGNASVIATDKTGTITEGKMKVYDIIGDDYFVLKSALLSIKAFIEEKDGNIILRGNPTEKAILEKCLEKGVDKTKIKHNKILDLPFDPKEKISGAVYKENGKNILYILGAPEKILEKSILKEKEKLEWIKKIENYAESGFRVVGSAMKEIENYSNIKDKICNLNFLGLIILKDPIRKDVKQTIEICKNAGLKVVIVTGDHKLTAKKVAEEIGLSFKDDEILEGKDLDKLEDEKLIDLVDKIKIYARVEPLHKLRIIDAFKKRGEIIAMTGDGVNDAPALKKADVGVVLGSGSDVAKEAGDLILLDDSFSTIILAIEEGRGVIDNIRKVITYLLSSTFTEIILVGTSVLANIHLPITPAQILWVNLIEDSLPSIALSFEEKEKDIMERKPKKEKSLFTQEMKILIFIVGILTDFLLLFLAVWSILQRYELNHLRTLVFSTLTISSISYAFPFKSLNKNIWHINILNNKFLIFAWILCLLLLLLGIYSPIFNKLLETTPLNIKDWFIVIIVSFINIFLIELAKFLYIKNKIKSHNKN